LFVSGEHDDMERTAALENRRERWIGRGRQLRKREEARQQLRELDERTGREDLARSAGEGEQTGARTSREVHNNITAPLYPSDSHPLRSAPQQPRQGRSWQPAESFTLGATGHLGATPSGRTMPSIIEEEEPRTTGTIPMRAPIAPGMFGTVHVPPPAESASSALGGRPLITNVAPNADEIIPVLDTVDADFAHNDAPSTNRSSHSSSGSAHRTRDEAFEEFMFSQEDRERLQRQERRRRRRRRRNVAIQNTRTERDTLRRVIQWALGDNESYSAWYDKLRAGIASGEKGPS
jgi:hypothetical protein